MSIKSALLKFSNRIKSDVAEKLAHLKNTSADENASNASISSSNTNIPTGDGRTFHQFRDLPGEIQSRIGVEATLANPEGLLAGLKTLRLVSHPRSNYLAAIPQLNRIEPMARELVNSVHEKMYPQMAFLNGNLLAAAKTMHFMPRSMLPMLSKIGNSLQRKRNPRLLAMF